MMARALDVIVAGELFVDLIMSGFDFWPQPGQEVFAREFHREIGGGAAITACGLARLGSRSGVLGVVGKDSDAWLIERLKENGVDTAGIRFDSTEPTGFTVVATVPEDRAFLTYAGANRRFEEVLMQAARAGQLSSARHIHLACAPRFEIAKELFDEIHKEGCTVSLDFGWREEWLSDARSMAVLREIDIFFPNKLEAQRLTGEEDPVKILQTFAAAGVERVALKLGSRGAALLWDGAIFLADAHPVAPLDTTGAGDCFDGGFLHAWMKGHDPELCLRSANVCGALSTEAYGGIAGFPSSERVEHELSCVR